MGAILTCDIKAFMIPSENRNLLIKTAINLVLDYVRWTQLVPMIIGWAFAIIMVLALFFISFEGQIDSLLQRAEPYAERLLGPAPENTETSGSGTVELSGDDIIPWIYRIWGAIAFAMWILSVIRTKIWGPPKKKGLKRKITLIGLAVISFVVLNLLFFMLIGTSNTRGELIIALTLPPILLFIVSCWGVGISHFISKIQEWVETLEFGTQEKMAIN